LNEAIAAAALKVFDFSAVLQVSRNGRPFHVMNSPEVLVCISDGLQLFE
jgi:hypothetical protein